MRVYIMLIYIVEKVSLVDLADWVRAHGLHPKPISGQEKDGDPDLIFRKAAHAPEPRIGSDNGSAM